MTAFAPDQNRSYGALELKRTHQLSLLAALLCAVALHFAAIGGARLYGHLTYMEPPPPAVPVEDGGGFVVLQPPPTVVREEPLIPHSTGGERPDWFIPNPVEDALVQEDLALATQTEKRKLVAGLYDGTGAGGTRGQIRDGMGETLIEVLPPPHAIIDTEEGPVATRRVMPVYPAFAEATGMSDTVVVRVLIDKKGNVRDVLIARASNSNVGFGEAALTAIRQWQFKPAVNNGHPVAVWVNIPILFEIE